MIVIAASAIFTMEKDDSQRPVVPMRQASECLDLNLAGYEVLLERNPSSDRQSVHNQTETPQSQRPGSQLDWTLLLFSK